MSKNTSEDDLLDQAVIIGLSDPWELGNELGWPDIRGRVIAVDLDFGGVERMLVELDEPFEWKGVECRYFVGSPRHEGRTFRTVAEGDSVPCGWIRISSERARGASPLDTGWWRGGAAIIANVELTRFSDAAG